MQTWGLGNGESAVLAQALARQRSVAVLDDSQAHMCARVLGVSVVGTLGIAMRAHRHRLIDKAAPLLRSLRDVGLRLDDAVIRGALERTTGETWS